MVTIALRKTELVILVGHLSLVNNNKYISCWSQQLSEEEHLVTMYTDMWSELNTKITFLLHVQKYSMPNCFCGPVYQIKL